jgi:hypothetical protein
MYRVFFLHYPTDINIFQKSRSHLQTMSAKKSTRSKIRIEDPQILGAMDKDLVDPATRICVPCTNFW